MRCADFVSPWRVGLFLEPRQGQQNQDLTGFYAEDCTHTLKTIGKVMIDGMLVSVISIVRFVHSLVLNGLQLPDISWYLLCLVGRTAGMVPVIKTNTHPPLPVCLDLMQDKSDLDMGVCESDSVFDTRAMFRF